MLTYLPLAVAALLGLAVGELIRRRLAQRRYRYPDERAFVQPRHGWLMPATGVLWAGLTWAHWDQKSVLAVLLAASVPLVALAAIDQDVHRLPDRLQKPLYPVFAAAFLVPAIVDGSWVDYGRALVGMVLGLAIYFALALIGQGGLGMGDVKLAGLLGILCGWVSWLALGVGLVAGFFIAGAFGIYLMIARGAGRKDFIPLGPALIAGALSTVVVLG